MFHPARPAYGPPRAPTPPQLMVGIAIIQVKSSRRVEIGMMLLVCIFMPSGRTAGKEIVREIILT